MTGIRDPRSFKGPRVTARRREVKGADRNQPCPCGSGLKAKRCDHTRRPIGPT